MKICGNSGGDNLAAMQESFFTRADTDGDKTISKDELQAALSKRPGGDGSKPGISIDDLFSQIDTDGSGGIDKAESDTFLKSHAHHGHRQGPPDPAKIAAKIFERADTDGDGSLTKDELIAALPKGASSAAIDNLFANGDTDGNGAISQSELETSLRSYLPRFTGQG